MDKSSAQYVPVPIQDFINGAHSPVNLHIRLGPEKFIMVLKAGTKTDKERLKKYEGKDVEYLWVLKKEYAKLAKSHLTIAGVIVNQENLSIGQKGEVLSAAAGIVFNELEHMGLGFEAYSHSKQIVEATVALAENHRDLYDLFDCLKDVSDDLIRHSMAVSMTSVMIAQQLRWENKQTIEKLALGALLHDVGLKAIPPELSRKPKSKMTFEEVQQYETHPFRGMKMLLELGIVPDDVMAVVYEHHENSIGQGFPRKLRNLKIHPLARVVAVADEFCNLVMASPNNPHPKNPREALMVIEHTMGQPFNKEAFRALQAVVAKEFLVKVPSGF